MSHAATKYDMAPEAYEYLDSALEFIRENSVYSSEIDWEALRAQVFEQSRGAETPHDTHAAIRFALQALGDNHSGLRVPADDDKLDLYRPPQEYDDPHGNLIDGKIAYLFLPGYSGDGRLADEHATIIQKVIASLDADSPCGWILDLRHNGGGNMWPMIAGLGPLLGEGNSGSFVRSNGTQSWVWFYREGRAGIKPGGTMARILGDAYKLREPNPPLAVLLGRRTACSGEAVAIAFIGRSSTMTFGQPTWGIVTGTASHQLADGSTIFVSRVFFADRTGKVYKGEIVPDYLIDTQSDSIEDSVRIAAIQWLLETPACLTSE
jgi:carboxyl-terminal processing protease